LNRRSWRSKPDCCQARGRHYNDRGATGHAGSRLRPQRKTPRPTGCSPFDIRCRVGARAGAAEKPVVEQDDIRRKRCQFRSRLCSDCRQIHTWAFPRPQKKSGPRRQSELRCFSARGNQHYRIRRLTFVTASRIAGSWPACPQCAASCDTCGDFPTASHGGQPTLITEVSGRSAPRYSRHVETGRSARSRKGNKNVLADPLRSGFGNPGGKGLHLFRKRALRASLRVNQRASEAGSRTVRTEVITAGPSSAGRSIRKRARARWNSSAMAAKVLHVRSHDAGCETLAVP